VTMIRAVSIHVPAIGNITASVGLLMLVLVGRATLVLVEQEKIAPMSANKTYRKIYEG
jgi:hypothetical protein